MISVKPTLRCSCVLSKRIPVPILHTALFRLIVAAIMHRDSVCATAAQDPGFVRDITWQAIQHVLPLVPPLSDSAHKGQQGRVAVLGGSVSYTGAPFYAGMAALTVGADTVSIFCAEEAAVPIKSYSPELMVLPIYAHKDLVNDPTALEISHVATNAAEKVKALLSKSHSIVMGPGLGRAAVSADLLYHVIEDAKSKHIPFVLDADALFLISDRLDMLIGYRRCVLTPNANELKILGAAVLQSLNDKSCPGDKHVVQALREGLNLFCNSSSSSITEKQRIIAVKAIARYLDGPTILSKGRNDLISTADVTLAVDKGIEVSPRRCGGQGDLLAGSLATIICWATKFDHSYLASGSSTVPLNPSDINLDSYLRENPIMFGCALASTVTSKAAYQAFLRHKRATLSTHILSNIGPAFEELSPALFTTSSSLLA